MIIWWVFNQCGAFLNQWKVFLKRASLNFNFERNEGFDKGWLKKLYLSDLTYVLDDLKFIGKLIQRSKTSMLMTSSNSEVLEIELRFEVETFVLNFFWYYSGLLCRKYQEVGKWFADFSAIVNFRGNSAFNWRAYESRRTVCRLWYTIQSRRMGCRLQISWWPYNAGVKPANETPTSTL